MANTQSSGGSRWFMLVSLTAMLAALIYVGLQMRKPSTTSPAQAAPETTEQTDTATPAPAPPPPSNLAAGNG